ncbi:tripartite tricarboxylate transporter substrate binding protein [Jiangella asiatica]|uniref:Tripartite tricarboxylate transporter substrate binding protein n=1 Tax=Jiangella asiatica TaxID=2530372 RepID=A0A4R5DF74_9ACTN|nr:tripartite tricarboxylate transporter substrate binding protein [Jiangella asiatica]TDE09285.1 tripartite tricarboxylate transporter substrate binding protein [Jiangella asiatica]
MRTKFIPAAAACLLLSACADTATGGGGGAGGESDFPTKPITAVVAWSAGGGTDVMMRAFAQSAEDHLGQPINVVNKPGSSGAVGWGEIAHATQPDGYTLTMVSPEIGFLDEQGLYDFGLDDFTLITLLNEDPAALAVRADAPWDTFEEFVADAKADPGAISVGNSGPGLAWDLATTAIERSAGIELTHVPYDGAAASTQAVLGGTLDAMAFSIGEVHPQVEAGEMKVLGVALAERLEALPNVPTFVEQGYDVEIGTFRGIAGPAGMDPEIVATLNDAFVEMAEEDTFADVMENNSFGIRVMETEEFQPFFEDARDLYVDLLRESE